MKDCQVCGQLIADPPGALNCSVKCVQGLAYIQGLSLEISEFVRNPDPRVFFYDGGFGELCDRYTIMLLRRVHQSSPNDQLESKYQLGRILQGITTRINKCFLDKGTLKSIGELIVTLFKQNASMWRSRSAIARTDAKEHPDKLALDTKEYFSMSDQRDLTKSQLDLIIDGRSRLRNRIY